MHTHIRTRVIGLQNYTEALRYYTYSEEMFGKHHITSHNKGTFSLSLSLFLSVYVCVCAYVLCCWFMIRRVYHVVCSITLCTFLSGISLSLCMCMCMYMYICMANEGMAHYALRNIQRAKLMFEESVNAEPTYVKVCMYVYMCICWCICICIHIYVCMCTVCVGYCMVEASESRDCH